MKFMPGPLIGNASGSVGGIVASRNRYGSYFRVRAIPVTSTTDAALNAKARFSTASQAWQALTDGQRLSWHEWALDHPVIDALGQQQELTGNAAYVMLNCRLAHVGGPVIAIPPVIPPPTGLETLVQQADIGIGAMDLVFAETPTDADQALYVQAAVVDSAGIEYVQNKLRFIGISTGAQASPFEHQTLVESRFGDLQVGQTVHVQVGVVDLITGLLSGKLAARTVVTETS